MKPKTSLLKRCLALALALLMLISSSNLGVALKASAAGGTTVTVGEIVAENYDDLTAAEKALLSSKYLAGGSVSYTAPADTELVGIDTDNATITAKSYNDAQGNTWTATTAAIVAGGVTVETVTLNNGVGSYDPSVGNAFSVVVTYVLEAEITEETQATLLNTAAWLQAGVNNLKNGYAADANLGTVVLAMDTLMDLANGITMAFGSASITAQFGTDAAAAVKALNAQTKANESGNLDLQDANAAYNVSASKVEYLLKEGSDYKNTLVDTYNKLNAIKNDSLTNNSILDSYLESADPAGHTQWMAFKNILGNLVSALEPVAAADWTAAEKGTALVDTATVNYAKLDELVAALGTTTEVSAIKNPLVVATAGVQKNLSMFNVTVTVALNVVEDKVDSDVLVEYAKTEPVVLTLADGATTEEIVAAIAEEGIEDSAKAAWGDAYVEGQYVASANIELPAELKTDINYVITYNPVEYTVTRNYDDDMTVPYGYQLTLPAYEGEDEESNYQYTVNGATYYGGDVIVVEGDVVVERSDEAKKTTATDLYTVVSDNFGNDVAQAILQSGALTGNTIIRVVKPNPADAEELYLTFANGVLEAIDVAADYKKLNWVPYTYGAEGTEKRFSGNSASFEGKQAKMQYILKLTNFTNAEVQAVLDLAVALKAEADAQVATMDRLNGYRSTMGQLDKTKLGALNGVIDVTDLHADPAKNEELKTYFKGLVSGIINNNLAANNYLKIYNYLGEYTNDGLRYYYNNHETVRAEIESLSGYLSGMLADDEKIAALETLVGAAGFPEYAEKIKNLESVLAEVKAALTAPNAVIDLESENLGKLLTALTSDKNVENQTAGTPWLLSDIMTVNDSTAASILVTITIGTKTAAVTTDAMDKGTVLNQEVIDALKAKVDAEITKLLGDNKAYYELDENAISLDSLVGTAITETIKIDYIYTATEYTVKIDGETDQTVTVEDLEINLPKHTEAGWSYTYTVDGVETTASTYTFTTEQLDRLFVNGTYTITRVAVNEAEEKLEGAFGEWVDKENQAINAEVDASQDGIMGFVMTFVNSGYTYIALNDEPLLTVDADGNLEISLQTLINAILNDNTFSSQTLIDLGDGEGKVVQAKIDLGDTTKDGVVLAYDNWDFVLNLENVPAQIKTIANGLDAIKNYMTFKSVDGTLVVDLNLPEKVYEVYLTALLATGHVDKSDMNAINNEIAFQFLWDYIDAIITSDADTDTFENTLKKLGQSYELSNYEDYYQMMKGLLTSEGVAINADKDDEEFLINVDMKGQETIKKLINMLGVDVSAYETYLGMIKEYKDPSAMISANAQAKLGNTAKDYQALVLDINAAGALNKFDYTNNAVARVADIANYAVVVLLDNVKGDLNIPGTTILDLNGKTVEGNITSTGTLLIVDSCMGTANAGTVTGEVTGNVTIVAGHYAKDVSAFVAEGYKQDVSTVRNVLYTVEENANGDVNFVLDLNFINEKGIDVVEFATTVAIDMAIDLVLNYATSESLAANGYTIYDIRVDDFIALYESNNKLDDLMAIVTGWVSVDDLNGFINEVIDSFMDLATIESAIRADEAFVSYEMTTMPWSVAVKHVEEDDYITFGIEPNEDLKKTFNVGVKVSGDKKTYIADLAGNLSDISTPNTNIDVKIDKPSYSNKNLTISGSGSAIIEIDLTEDQNPDNATAYAAEDYATVIAVVLANGGSAQADALVDAINAGKLGLFQEALNKVTVQEIFTALKALNLKDNFAALAAENGVTVDTDNAAALEDIYHLIAVAAGAALEKLDITGPSKTMGSLLADDGWYTYTTTRSAEKSVSARGFSLTVSAEVTEVTIRVKLLPDHVHTPGEPVEENRKDATCTEDGSYDSVIYCSDPDCGVELSRETVVIPANGHTAGETVVENEIAADCVNAGSYDNVVYCAVCGEEISRETVSVPATGHIPGEAVEENRFESTCAVAGSYDEVVYCDVCGEELSRETKNLPLADHTPGEIVIENVVEATCSEPGSHDEVVYCSVCGEELSRETVEDPATGNHVDNEEPWHACDICGTTVSECVDEDGDGYCDICGAPMHCEEPHDKHVDEDKDHYCDVCGKRISWCRDCDRDHYCDICGEKITCCIDFNRNHRCDICWKDLGDCADKNNNHYCDVCGKKLTDCIDEDENGVCDICGKVLDVAAEVIRIGGDVRSETARMIANELKAVLGVEKFDAIVYASGDAYPDALTGTYLANMENAPILLYRAAQTEKNLNYIVENLAEDGVVYILGGTAAIPASVEEELVAAGIEVVRLGGISRYETNLEILDATVFDGGETVLVCTGNEYPDALAASATGMPILLVNNKIGKLNDLQVDYLSSLANKCNFILIGGEGAICAEIAAELASYDLDGTVDRIGGETRYETCVMIAEMFFDGAEKAVVAYGREYPDALCGGTLGYALNAPIILVQDSRAEFVAEYLAEEDIASGYILGGTARVSDAVACKIFALASADEIIVR